MPNTYTVEYPPRHAQHAKPRLSSDRTLQRAHATSTITAVTKRQTLCLDQLPAEILSLICAFVIESYWDEIANSTFYFEDLKEQLFGADPPLGTCNPLNPFRCSKKLFTAALREIMHVTFIEIPSDHLTMNARTRTMAPAARFFESILKAEVRFQLGGRLRSEEFSSRVLEKRTQIILQCLPAVPIAAPKLQHLHIDISLAAIYGTGLEMYGVEDRKLSKYRPQDIKGLKDSIQRIIQTARGLGVKTVDFAFDPREVTHPVLQATNYSAETLAKAIVTRCGERRHVWRIKGSGANSLKLDDEPKNHDNGA